MRGTDGGEGYLARMASLCLLDLALNCVYIAVSGQYALLGAVLSWNLFLLLAVNLVVARWIVAPVAILVRGETDPRRVDAGLRRLASLPGLSATWVAILTMFYTAAVANSGGFTPESAAISAVPTSTKALALVWFMFIYAAYYGFFVYFLVGDHAATLCLRLFQERGLEIQPRAGGYRLKLALVLLVLALLPNIHLMLDLTVLAPIREAQGISVAQTVFIDLLATLTIFCIALIFISRALTRPIAALRVAVDRISDGTLDTRAPVMSADDVGVLSASFNRMLEALRERAFIRETFGKYVPESVVEAIVSGREPVDTRRATATILFADIADFTRTCESMQPEDVVAMLNEYYEGVVEVIERHGGVVNQFQGDAILVTFNVPVPDAKHAEHAVAAAEEIQTLVDGRRFAGTIIRTRIGINTGTVVAGNVGSRGRYNYTVHGDAVNVAARLERMNKALGTRTLIAEPTVILLPARESLQPLGSLEVEGKTASVQVYGLPSA